MNPDIIGHHGVRLAIRKLVVGGQFPHASLFQGPSGVGKGLVAMATAQSLLCTAPVVHEASQTACGECSSCVIFVAGNHPDLFVIRSSGHPKRVAEEKDDDAESAEEDVAAIVADDDGADDDVKSKSRKRGPGTIKIEYIRKFQNRIVLAPMMSSRQVAVIPDADLMQGPAANALLKTLEEPPPNRHIILVSSRPWNLPVTIRSRSAKFTFHGLQPDEADTVLKNLIPAGEHDPALVEFYTGCFPSAPAHAAKALELPLTRADWDEWMSGNRSFVNATRLAKELAGAKTNLDLFLEVLRAVTIKRVKQSPDAAGLDFLDAITAAKRRLERHIANAFVLENLLM